MSFIPTTPVAMDTTTRLMQLALAQARLAAACGDVPVGAVVAAADGTILAQAHNEVEARSDPFAHAEMLALRAACAATGGKFLDGCTLVVTLEPCAMCAQAIAMTRISTLVFGAYDPKSGGTVNNARVLAHSHHKPEVLGGIAEEACRELLTGFFRGLRGDTAGEV